MKCKYCGAALKIEDERCPYCGQLNPDAAEHRKKMRRYHREYEQTKKDIYAKTNRYAGWTVKITILSALIVLNVLFLTVNGMSWEIAKQITNIKVNADRRGYTELLDRLESEGKFRELAVVYESNHLWQNEYFDEYRAVQYMASQYGSIFDWIMRYQCMTEDGYDTPEEIAESVSEQLEYFYEQLEEDRMWDEKQYTQKHRKTMEAMVDEVHLLLKTYFHVSDEELERFPELSAARRQLVLERGMGINE